MLFVQNLPTNSTTESAASEMGLARTAHIKTAREVHDL